MKTEQILENALGILKTAGWCQGYVATDKKTGHFIWKMVRALPEKEINNYSFCAVGALLLATKEDSEEEFKQAEKALGAEIPDGYSIASYNDTRGRTFEEIEALFQAAITKQKETNEN